MSKPLYRIQFVNQDQVYEIYAAKVASSSMFGFIEVEELRFGEHSTVLIDPAEERLQSEFAGVKRSLIPLNAVIRIDEVEKQGTAKIHAIEGKGKVAPFPVGNPPSQGGSS